MEFNNNRVNNVAPQQAPQNQQVPYQQPAPQPMPQQTYYQQPQMPQQPQGQPMSQMDRLRMQMQQQGQQQPQATTMQQGGTYNPTGQQTPQPQQAPQQQQVQQPQQQQNTPNDDSTDSGNNKPKMSPKAILIGVGLFIVVLVLMFVFSQLNKADKDSNQPSGGSVDEFGNPIDGDTAGDDDLIFIMPNDDYVGYSFDQVEELRAAGYTGTEIEENETNGVPFEDLIKQAEDARQAWIDEAIAPLYDTASDEYKNSVKNTWLGLSLREDVDDFTQVGSYYEDTKNFDYEKVEARGFQLYVKIYLDDTNHDDFFFLAVEPSEYLQLKDSGNVVVTYRYVLPIVWDEENQAFIEDESRMFIVDAELTIFN